MVYFFHTVNNENKELISINVLTFYSVPTLHNSNLKLQLQFISFTFLFFMFEMLQRNLPLVGLEPATLESSGKHATPRPPRVT